MHDEVDAWLARHARAGNIVSFDPKKSMKESMLLTAAMAVTHANLARQALAAGDLDRALINALDGQRFISRAAGAALGLERRARMAVGATGRRIDPRNCPPAMPPVPCRWVSPSVAQNENTAPSSPQPRKPEMTTLHQEIRNVRDLLSMSPEELAGPVLRVAHFKQEHGLFDPATAFMVFRGTGGMAEREMPHGSDSADEVLAAVARALEWLIGKGLVELAPGPPLGAWLMRVSPAGQQRLDTGLSPRPDSSSALDTNP